MSKIHQKKAKLRPARDVISRLRWGSESHDQVVFGYIDRINGTMEKAVDDYTPMSEGGDIPEHRILYFRRVTDGDNDAIAQLPSNIIWDRAGRADRVFDSGCRNKDISADTIEEATAAIHNMARLEQENAERREQKARQRARRAKARAAERKAAAVLSEHTVDSTEISGSRSRFQWKDIPWHYFAEDAQQWKEGGAGLTSPSPGVDYLCILDFEATCNEKKPAPRPQEIIEFPTLLLNTRTGEVEREFHHYIKPDVHPILSEFCTQLTGITQSMVDGGISLDQALLLHQEWINEISLATSHPGNTSAPTFAYVTCGDWDLNVCLPKQLRYNSKQIPSMFKNWINIKRDFQVLYGKKAGGMTGMLRELGMELQGRHHSGIDDCRNIVRICQRMLQDGWVPSNATQQVLSMPTANVKAAQKMAAETKGSKTAMMAPREEAKSEGNTHLTVLTWNVLSNIYGTGVDDHNSRWALLAEAICKQSPDIVALQEATSDFVEQVLAIDWIRSDYASSISPHDKSSVDPIGQVLLWKHQTLKPADCMRALTVLGGGLSQRPLDLIMTACWYAQTSISPRIGFPSRTQEKKNLVSLRVDGN